ncbi:polysaccharide pyruvyl transferase family protein [Leucobacter sp. GX24907]
MSKIRILLLTNRDSDNIGDQIIEATVISLIKGVMENLGIPDDGYSINSRAAGIISKKYMRTREPELLAPARKAISEADVVIFGGAPLFNYSYQNFYLRTIKTLELAEEYGVPVIFSSIGVEAFEENNPKCLELKKALSMSCVKQITTRDDFESLQKYVEGTGTPIDHVADPAVFADIVFRERPEPILRMRSRVKRSLIRIVKLVLGRSTAQPSQSADIVGAEAEKRKRIGLVVTRAGIFKDNGIDFSESDQRRFWLATRKVLLKRGYEVRLLTTGHFSDEVFLDSLVKDKGLPASEAAVVINTPEGLIKELTACDGVIAYRLHANITAFAYGIPSVGLNWNFKVPYFYEAVGYGRRALESERWTADSVVPTLEAAMSEGVEKNEALMMTVYDSLFEGLKSIISPESSRTAYSYAELREKLPPYPGTTPAEYQEKARRKMRRTYENYQKLYRSHVKSLEKKH